MKKQWMSFVLLSLVSTSVLSGNGSENYREALQVYCSKDYGTSSFTVSVGDAIPIYNRLYPMAFVVGEAREQPLENVFIERLQYSGLTSECAEYLLKNATITTEELSKNTIVGRVFFGFDKSSLSKESKYVLAEVIQTLQTSQSTLRLEGNTDSTGSVQYNLALGLKRASGVKTYVVDNDVLDSRITIQSNGENAPMADNKTAKGRAQNRRVDIVVN